MAVKTVFEDNNSNEMDCYVNHDNLIFLTVGNVNADKSYEWGFITLNKKE